MKRTYKILAACTLAAFAATSVSADILWQDDDPATPALTSQNAGLAVNPVASAVGNSAIIGSVETDTASQYSSIGPITDLDVTAYQGQAYTFSFDYYVPSTGSGVLEDDLWYSALIENGGQTDTAGFITLASATQDSWVNFSTSGTIGVGTTTLSALFIYVDGGWNGGGDQASGTSMYLDNVKFEAVPEPATFGLLGLSGAALFFIRRLKL